MCGCSAPIGRFPRRGDLVDIQLLEFEGLGYRKGFRVKSRQSALDDGPLRAAILERTYAILSLLEDGRTEGRAEREIEFLKTDLSETERLLGEREAEIKTLSGNLASRDKALQQLKPAVQQWKDHASKLERTLRESKNRIEACQSLNESKERALRRMRARVSGLASDVRTLLETLEPIFEKAEYVAMDDQSFAQSYQDAQEAIDAVRRSL